jgi:L-lactate dehydrogenase complex protein LldG
MSADPSSNAVLDKVRRALGRSKPPAEPPVPPEIPGSITRLVNAATGLADLFARTARENKMYVEQVSVDELTPKLIDFLKAHACATVMLPDSEFLEKLGVVDALRRAGFAATRWSEMTLDAAYDVDVAVTDVYCGVAETGSLVIRPSPGHGRVISLVPPIHVAILEPTNFVPDLVDLMGKLTTDGAPNVVLVTGPSKTADIEMQLVTGVHGPGHVHLFLLQ